MKELLKDAKEELKRVDHLIYVSLKYTRTVDVIRNVIDRLISSFDFVADGLLQKALDEKKIKEIILSQAAVWNRLSREQQVLVLKEVPPEADWWLAIAAVEGLNERAGTTPAPSPDAPARVVLPASAVRAWRLEHLLAERPELLLDRVRRLQAEAAAAERGPPFNSNPQPDG